MIQDRFNRSIPNTSMKNRVVFWTDPKEEFSEKIDSIQQQLKEITVLKWDGFNSFRIKVMIEYEESEKKFLVYMPGKVPQPKDNILADMMYYSKPTFSADNASCICLDLQIPDELKSVVGDHYGFFKLSKEKEKIRKYAPFETEEEVLGSMVAVTVSAVANDLDSITVKLIGNYSESPDEYDEEICDILDSYNLLDSYWTWCRKEYGFEGKSIGDLASSLFITASFETSVIAASKQLSKYILPYGKGARASAIVRRLLSSSDKEGIRMLSGIISEKCGVGPVLKDVDDLNSLKDCYVFSCIDTYIIERMIERILSTRSALEEGDLEYLNEREKNTNNDEFKPIYSALRSASRLLNKCRDYSSCRSEYMTAKSIVDGYVTDFYVIDTLYRHFVYSLDSVSTSPNISEDLLTNLKDYIENTYCNVFLDPIVSDFCKSIKDYFDLPGPYQQDFCKKYIDENKKTVVVISDAFRYECAKELYEILKATSRVNECTIDHMTSTVPSKTNFGMAALLPNNGIEVKLEDGGKCGVFIEGLSTEFSFRQSILRSRYPESIVLKYEYVKDNKVSDLRKELSGKKVIYVYHNSIDMIGESADRQVFSACERAIREIAGLITKLTNCNCANFIVTADHGFIYRRSEIEEYNKLITDSDFNSKRRCALNNHRFNLEHCIEFSLGYLDVMDKDLYVAVPDSIALFRRQGETKCYAHEGISPQEIIVPVLTVNTKKGAVTEKYVGLKPSNKRDIKQYNPRFELWQDNPVNDEYHKCEYEVWLEDNDDQLVSQKYTIIADKEDPSDLRHILKMKVGLQKKQVTLVIRRKGESEEQRTGFTVKLIGSF